jgi:ATP-binding cassette subfamily C protein
VTLAADWRAVRPVLAAALRGRGRDLRRLALWSALEAVPALLSGRLVAQAIDDGFLSGRTGTGLAWLGVLAASMALGAWGTRQVFRRLAALVEPLRDRLVERVVEASLMRATATGAAPDASGVAALTRQVEIAREAYASVLMVVQGFVITTASALVGLATLAPAALVLVGPSLVVALAVFAVALALTAARQRASILAEERIADSVGAVSAGMRDVVAAGGEEQARAGVGRHVAAQARATRRLGALSALQTLAIAIGGWLPVILILAAGSWLVGLGASTGALVGAITYVLHGVLPALESLVRGLGATGMWLLVSLRRVVASADGAPPERPSAPAAAPCGHELALEGVTFAYGGRAEPVIRELDLGIPGGEHLAIVGASGIGKSTLAALMAGLLEPQRGDVRIGGATAHRLPRDVAAAHRVLIPQQAYVVRGTVRENLTYLAPDRDDAAVEAAVERLGAAPLVRRLGGLGAEVRPDELSAGERQLLTLVRAYLSPAPVAILDEATCHLDPAAEAHVEREFAERPGTLIVVAHRISSALRARRVLLLDGDAAFLGTHPELLARSPFYRDLVGRWQAGDVPAAARPARSPGL